MGPFLKSCHGLCCTRTVTFLVFSLASLSPVVPEEHKNLQDTGFWQRLSLFSFPRLLSPFILSLLTCSSRPPSLPTAVRRTFSTSPGGLD